MVIFFQNHVNNLILQKKFLNNFKFTNICLALNKSFDLTFLEI